MQKILSCVSDDQRLGLLFFFAFTGSDFTSAFCNLSKIGWWKVWSENNFISQTFAKLSWAPTSVDETDFSAIEKFVCTAYDPQNRYKCKDVNKLRSLIFSKSYEKQFKKVATNEGCSKTSCFCVLHM